MVIGIPSCYHCERLSEVPIMTKLDTKQINILNKDFQTAGERNRVV